MPDFDLSQLFGQAQPSGLLTADDNANANQNALMSAGAAMLKAAGPSPFRGKMTTAAGLGDALQAALTSRQNSVDSALKQKLLTQQIRQNSTAQVLQAAQLANTYKSLSLPIPPGIQRIIDAASGSAGSSTSPPPAVSTSALPAVPTLAGAPGSGGGAPVVPSQQSTLPWPAPGASPGVPGAFGSTGLPSGQQNAQAGTLPAGLPPSVAAMIAGLPLQDRYALMAGGPMGDIVKATASKNAEVTEAQKNASASGGLNPLDYERTLRQTPDERAAAKAGMSLPEYAAYGEGLKAVTAAKGKQMADAIEAGGHAQKVLGTLNTMEDALNHAPADLNTGPGAKTMLALKQFGANLGFDFKGVPEAETIDKLNAFLASEATKQISSRPAMFEFATFMKNNPGLQTSIEGTRKLISILRQGAESDVALGKAAGDERSLPHWPEVVDAHYKSHPIISPFTGQPIDRDHPAVPPPLPGAGQPPPTQGAPPAPQAAAPAAGIPTATDPKTGHTVRFVNGAWQ
jgi:hypothetical protein